MRRVSLQILGNVKSLFRGVNNQTNLQVLQTERIYQYFQLAVLVKALEKFILSEVNFQSTWRGRNTLSNTCYGISKNV